MSLRWIVAVAVLVGCGNGAKSGPDEPTTAKEKQLLEAKKSGDAEPRDKSWGTWRYSGDRENCFFVVGRKCFKSENGACQFARCKNPKKCKTVGAGPATVSCK